MYNVIDIAFDEIAYTGSAAQCAAYAEYWNTQKGSARYEVCRAREYALVG